MKAAICPFCGLPTEIPHETQQGCIDALNAEITRTREILEQMTEPLRPPMIAEDDEAHAR